MRLTVMIPLLACLQTAAAQVGLPVSERTHQESDYIVLEVGTGYAAQNARTGALEVLDPDAGVVLNGALAALPRAGGRIWLRAGDYVVGTTVDLRDRVLLEGAPGAVLRSPSLSTPLMRATGCEDLSLVRLTFADCKGTALRLQGGARLLLEECRFEDLQREAIANFTDVLQDLWIRGCLIERAGLSSSDAAHYPALSLFRISDATLSANRVRDCGSTGISIWSSSERIVVEDNNAMRNGANAVTGQGHGIIVGGGSGVVTLRGNVVSENAYNGIEANSGSAGSRYVVSGNIALGNGLLQPEGNKGAGIYITYEDAVVANNLCLYGQGAGIKVGYKDHAARILIQGNIVGDNGQAGSLHPLHTSGISLTGASSTAPGTASQSNVHVLDNLIFNSALGSQAHAVYAAPDVEGVRVEGNRVWGHTAAEIEVSFATQAGNRVARNEGFATEAAGTASILAGSQQVAIPHGLDVTPSPEWVQLLPHGDLCPDGQARSFWLDGVTSSELLLRCSSPLPAEVSFGWMVLAR